MLSTSLLHPPRSYPLQRNASLLRASARPAIMPPKKLSISQIRAESRVRSHDPDLNRSSSSTSYRRSTGSSSNRAVASSSSSPRGSTSKAGPSSRRPKRPVQPKQSARILHILEDDIEETRVQNLFAPDPRTQRQNVSYRPLTLTQQARRDGAAFRLPSLSSMCASVVASCFDALLPSRDHFEAAAGPSSSSSNTKSIRNSRTLSKASTARKRSRARAFGAAPDSDEDQQDYVPSDDDTSAPRSSRSTRSRRDGSRAASSTAAIANGSSQLLAGWTTSELHYLTRKTSEQLKLLSPAASFLLFRALIEQAPQHLTKTVVSTYFLPPVLGDSTAPSSLSTAAARTHVWLPASMPLLSQDKSAASFLVAHLTNALTSARGLRPSILSEAAAEDLPLATLPSRLVLSQPASFALRSLQLHGLTRLQDGTLARFFEAAVPSAQYETILKLDTISLKGCISVGDRTVSAICRSTGTTLRYLNLDFTDVTADSVASTMKHVPDLHTLKLGYNENLTDKTLQVALEAPSEGAELPFSKLRNLRLRQCAQVSDQGVACFLKYAARTLEKLDISGTLVGGTNPHQPDLTLLLMGLFPLGVPAEPDPTAPLRKLNLLDTNVDYFTLRTIINHSPNVHTLLLKQMPSPVSRDGMIMFLEQLATNTVSWRDRPWTRLHLKVLDVGDSFADLFPDLLVIYPRLTVESLKTSMSQAAFFHEVPHRIQPDSCRVQHLKLPDAKMSDHAWTFLPLISTLRSLDLSNTAVPEDVVKRTIGNNPFLELIDLSHCKQMRISTRRNAFDLVDE